LENKGEQSGSGNADKAGWKLVAHACVQPGIAADRFAREIVGILKARCGALAAPECQAVGPPTVSTRRSSHLPTGML